MTAYIGYQNLLEQSGATVTASSEATGYDVENAFDWLQFDAWKPSADGDAYIDVTLATAANADYFSIAWHTLGVNGARAQLFYDDAGTWTPAGATVSDPAGTASVLAPAGGRVAFAAFAAETATDWRVMFYSKQNLFRYSEDASNSYWSKNGGTTIVPASISLPQGFSSAFKIVEGVGGSIQGISRVYPLSVGWHTLTIRAKAAERSSIKVQANLPSVVTGIFDLSAGTASGGDITDLGGGWYECSITFYEPDGVSRTLYPLYYTVSGDGSSGVYATGMQLEAAPSPGLYQATTDAAVTNNPIGQVGMLALGQALALGDIRAGFEPPGLIEHGEAYTSQSEGGKFLGRSIRKTGEKVSVDQTVIAASWPRTYLDGFAQHALRKPYFFAWDPTNYPGESVIVIPPEDGGIRKPAYDSAGYMRWGFEGIGWRE